MEKRTLLGIKRTCEQISTTDDIKDSNNKFVDLARKIFVNNFSEKYEELELSLYQTPPYKHPQYPSIEITPDFVRDDGVIIYLNLIQNGNYLRNIDEQTIQLAMEILKLKNAELYTITIKSTVNIETMGNKISTAYSKLMKNVSYIYKPQIVKDYVATFVSKRKKLNDCKINNKPIINTNEKIVGFNYNDWVAASKTRNFALKDTLIDWLDCYGKKNENLKTTTNSSYNNPNNYNFGKFIMSKGNDFEKNVIDLIRKKLKPNEFITIAHSTFNMNANTISQYETDTINEIMKGTPVIYQGLLMNRTGDLKYSYGFPDLLVRSDYLSKIIDRNPLAKNMATRKAPNLNGKYHYVIVDIKFTTLELCSDGKRIRNSGSVPAFKCQLYIYNHALGIIQGYESPESYILGRKYKFESKGKLHFGKHCFERFGHIEYSKWDNLYISEAISAIQWIRRLRMEGKEWELLPKPTVPELYPNMSSTYDTQWDSFKIEYANTIGEITLLWNCGVKNREIAHENGVYSFMDRNCCSEIVGINGPKQAPILNEIIKINRKSNFDTAMERIFMKINKDIDNHWIDDCSLRISVDFETINNIFDDFKSLPFAQDQNYLFMIGVGYKVKDQPIQYKMFLAAELSKDAEFQMIYQFYRFLKDITDTYIGKGKPIPSLYHWGHIERSFFDGLCNRLVSNIGNDIVDDIALMKKELDWFDLSECFKNNPIVINGCFKFGLKEVATRLSGLGLIKSSWNNSECTNGNTAMVMAQRAYQMSKQTGTPIVQNCLMKEIIDYNKIDCIVVQEIIDLMREKAKEIKK